MSSYETAPVRSAVVTMRVFSSSHDLIDRVDLSVQAAELILATFTAPKEASTKESPVVSHAEE